MSSSSSESESTLSSWSTSSVSSVSDVTTSSSSFLEEESESSSSSSSSSSWSSESSQWDQPVWFSVFHTPPVKTGQNDTYVAEFGVDLRHSDAEMIRAKGPLEIDLGGEYGETVLPEETVRIIDDYRTSKTFDTLVDAQEWQDIMFSRTQSAIITIRNEFLFDYPVDFDKRHRRV